MRVLIFHFRSAPAQGELEQAHVSAGAPDTLGTDGVSLEIAKRQRLLEEMGHEVLVCSAYGWADYPVPALEFDREELVLMARSLFGSEGTGVGGEADVKEAFESSRRELKVILSGVVDRCAPDLVFVHNMFSLPVHPAATTALAEVLREAGIPCAAIHHDVLSEGTYKFKAVANFASELLEQYFPPRMHNLQHWTINTRNKSYLKEQGLDAGVIHDTMDFDRRLDPGERARIRANLRSKHGLESSDIVLLVSARIVPNKQLEIAGRVTSVMQHLRGEIVGKKLYNDQPFSESSRIVLVVGGRPERGFADYQARVFECLNQLHIPWVYAGDSVRPERVEEEDLFALYPDLYTMADFVLYPTRWEGFGNQLLEAFAAELPVALFEYPVFKEDIAHTGVRVVSLGDRLWLGRGYGGLAEIPTEVLAQAASEMTRILTSAEVYRDLTSHNLITTRKHFGSEVLRLHLNDVLQWAESQR
jgi:mannosylglucosylglycerate synthase